MTNFTHTSTAESSEGRPNNVALVTRELLHFGPDFIRLCLGRRVSPSRSLNFLDAIFSLSHNDTNASTYKDFVWADSSESVDIQFGKTLHGDAAYIRWETENILCIEKLSTTSTFYQNIDGKYEYVVSFYGDFFAMPKLGFDVSVFWDLFELDIRMSVVEHCVSRLDICADIRNITVKEIADGVMVESSRHAKKFTPLNVDWETRSPETWYYGNTKDKRWHARVYNKLIDIQKKGKEYLYPAYWGLDAVTRVEIELREVCRECGITFLNCSDVTFLLSLFKTYLETKYVSWKILPFVLGEMQRKGYDPFKIEKLKPDYNQMTNWRFYKLTVSKNAKCIKRMGIEPVEYFKRLQGDVYKELAASSTDDAK